MLEVIYGNDREKLHSTLKDVVLKVKKRCPEVLEYTLDDLTFSQDLFMQYFSGGQLFGDASTALIICKHVLEKKENETWFIERLASFGTSGSSVILVERGVSKDFLEACKKEKIEVHPCTLVKKEEPEFNIFSLTDMFGARKRKEAWLIFQKALRAGVTPEMILWKLHWQIKTMVIARTSEGKDESGLHPFVYQKALGYASKFEDGEMESLSGQLIKIYEDDRSGRREMEFGLELFLLSI